MASGGKERPGRVLVPVAREGDGRPKGSRPPAGQPIHQQIAARLRAAIADGTYPVGARLPT